LKASASVRFNYCKRTLASLKHKRTLALSELETDAPYLAPVPFRGKRNESFYVIEVAKKQAELKKLGLAQVAEITTENSKLVYGI